MNKLISEGGVRFPFSFVLNEDYATTKNKKVGNRPVVHKQCGL